MAQINLTLEEKNQIIEALNQGLEPSPDLLPKIFPGTADKFDVVALDRAKIPTLEYAGKRTKAVILAEAVAGIGAAPLQTVRCFGNGAEDDWKNLIVQGDNLQFLKTCYKNVDPLIKDKVKGKVKLIYIDPPFATKSDFGGKDGEYSYADKVDRARFLETLRERLIYLRELLADDGSIYVHLDQKMTHYAKVLMDEVFDLSNFKNSIIWRRTSSHNDPGRYGIVDDAILFYTNSNKWVWNDPKTDYEEWYVERYYNHVDEVTGKRFLSRDVSAPSHGGASGQYEWKGKKPGKGRMWAYKKEKMEELDQNNKLFYTSNGIPRLKQFLDEMDGTPLQSVWDDILPIVSWSTEGTNYPTQKPYKLLERIISASSNKDDLVLDCFAGSGTTGAVAEKLDRRWIMCDFGKHAVYTMQKRMLRIAESKKLGKDIKSDASYGIESKPFCVVSTGAYDFTHVMDLRKNKDTYIDFVLGLFQLVKDEDKANKFHLSNIYSLKDNNPVEVYPVWDDQYLKEIRIDEVYLQSIVDQAGGRLRGDYYIITPESCTNVGDTTLKNQDGKEVNFYIKTFPYKILEDISQKLELQEQASSAQNINNLVTSTSFYFNEDVEIEVVRVDGGLQLSRFDTKILNGEGNRFEGISGLAMLLIDLNYESGKPFDMDVAVYSKEVGEDGVCKVADLTASIGVIAIDKHGNESKPFQVK